MLSDQIIMNKEFRIEDEVEATSENETGAK
jgi:hypothetical protein